MRLKKIALLTVLSISVLCLSLTPMSAEKKYSQKSSNITGYIWNESTGTSTTYDPANFPTEVTNTVNPDKQHKENAEGIIVPMLLYMYTFDHYSETSSNLDWQKQYVGVTRIDNSKSISPTTLTFTASASGSFGISGTTGLETSAEKDAIVAKVKISSSVSGTASRSWTAQTTYGTATTVPAKTIGKVTAYIPGTASNGYAVYKVTNTSNSDWWWQDRERGAIVPAQNAWNMIVEIPCK